MTTWNSEVGDLKRALVLSLTAHVGLFLFVLISPHLPKTSRKSTIHYVNVISFPGGGGGASGGGKGGGEKVVDTAVPARETLKDLTTPQKLQEEVPSSLKHPVEKPEKVKKTPEKKKAVIQKQTTPSEVKQQEAATGPGEGTGSGVKIGIGSGPGSGGGGFSSAFSSQIGLSNFPFTYYLQILVDRISNNWFTSQVSPGLSGNFHSTVFFKIYKDGQISDLTIEESSGIKSLDLSALRAIQTSAPFPPLPREYEEEYLGIHLIFEHNK